MLKKSKILGSTGKKSEIVLNKKLQSERLYLALQDLLSWFNKSDINGIIIGGVAVSLLSQPRVTRDIDALVLLDVKQWQKFLESGKEFEYYPRAKDAVQFALKHRVLLVKHTPTFTDVDISFGALPFEKESISRAIKIKIADISIPVPTPEDLVIMKAVAHRPIDLEDIRNILALNPKIDYKRINYWVEEFAGVLGMPEIMNDLEKLLKKNREN
jgi:hypothetical protein